MDRHLPIARRSFALRSFDKLAEDAENQVRDILDADDCPAVKSEALYRSFLNTDAIEPPGLTQSATSLTSSIPPSTRPHSRACSARSTQPAAPICSAWPFTATRATRTATSPTLSRPAFVCRMKLLSRGSLRSRARSIRGDGRHPAGERRIRARRRVQRWR